jgi:hypothetical protein
LLIFAVHFVSASGAPGDALQTYFYSSSCAGVTIHVLRTGVIMVARFCSRKIEWIEDRWGSPLSASFLGTRS